MSGSRRAVPPADERPAAHRGRSRLRGSATFVGRWVVLALIVEYLIVPQLAGTRNSWHLLLDADNLWLLAAVALEAASLAVYAALTRAVLPARPRPSYSTVLRIDLSTLAVSHLVPGGSAVGLGLGYRLLTGVGVPGTDAVFTKATQAVGSAVVLNVMLWLALVASIPLHGFSSVYGPVAVAGVLLLTGAGVLVVMITRGQQRIAQRLARLLGRLPRVTEEGAYRRIVDVTERVRVFVHDRRLLASTAILAALNWLFDAAALWACVRGFGHTLGPAGLIVPYGIAAVLASLPITPAGLGVVEASLIPALVAFSVPKGVAILGVLSWRAINFLLPIPVGALSYLSLSWTRRKRLRAAAQASDARQS